MKAPESILASFPPAKISTSLSLVPGLKKTGFNKLAIFTRDETRFIPFGEIVYCQSQSNYSIIYTRNGKMMLCSTTLGDVEKKLPAETFLRVHHSYLVNINDITALKKRSCELEINNGINIPFSRTVKKRLYGLLCLE